MIRLSLLLGTLAVAAASQEQGNLRRGLIVGGQDAVANEFPAFGQAVPWNMCGGALLFPDMVVTAASCNFAVGNTIAFGSLASDGSGAAETRTIIEMYPHFSYDNSTNENDIMLLKLNTPSSRTPASWNTLPGEPVDGATTVVVGYGDTTIGTTSASATLQRVDTTILSNPTCNAAANYNSTRVTPDMLCAQGAAGEGSCSGDEGGPLFNSASVIVGIYSFRDGCNPVLNPPSATPLPAVYTRISSYTIWLQQVFCANTAVTNKPSFCPVFTATPAPTSAPPAEPGTCNGGFPCFVYLGAQGIGLVAAAIVALLFALLGGDH